ncbi:MAG TPA: nuclear transport factor 2 family protein [Terracidiphilus sp.]|nr:nuclear transport factor 2 family protein [Terracidiphilus sp.]
MKSFPDRVQMLLLLLVVTLPLYSQQSKPEAVKAEIAAIEEHWLHALETTDLAALDSILAEDFTRPAPSAGAFITKSQLLDYFKSHRTSTPATRHIKNLNVTLYGNIAIARGNVVIANPSSHVVSRNLFTDVFVRRKGLWLAVSAQENDTVNH